MTQENKIKHLLIIGAGASKSINPKFPIGEELINMILGKMDTDFNNVKLHNPSQFPLNGKINYDTKQLMLYKTKESGTFHNVNSGEKFLNSIYIPLTIGNNIRADNPLSIDAFAGNIQDGRIIIDDKNDNTKEFALKFIKDIITNILKEISLTEENYFNYIVKNYIGFSNLENVEIINFNYDLCLEKTIEGILEKQWNLSEEIKKRLEAFKEKLKKSHFYGDIKKGIDFIRHKPEDSENFRDKFLRAENIYFLGFGFDNLNINNLGLNDLYGINAFQKPNYSRQNVFLTNYGSNAKIQNVVSRIFNVNQFFISNETRVEKVNKERKVEEKLLISKTGISEDKRFKVHIAEMDCFEAVKYNFVF
jgi:hypothetical protein